MIIAVIAVPLVIVAGLAVFRGKSAGEHPPGESDATRARTQQEFADAERYQEEWREAERKRR